MRISFLVLLFNLCLAKSEAQVTHWTVAGLPITGRQIRSFYNDTISNKLYVGGEILDSIWDFSKLSLCVYDGVTWDTLGLFDQQQLCITKFNNDLIVGGFFSMVNGVPVHFIARYDGISWHPFGNFNHHVLRLKVIDGELYAAGQFDSVDSMPIHGIAKWTGTQWTDVHAFPWNPYSAISDFTEYNNELYVAGDFNIGGVEDMMFYHNGSWQEVGQGFGGFLNWVDKLEVLNGELYAGGSISLSDGNVGNGIQKWNGISWSKVGDNLQDVNDSYANRIEVFDMTVHNNELYCVGLFQYAGHVSAKHLAKWTGNQWCGFGTANEFDMVAYLVTVFNDTMYISSGIDTINGISTGYLIKWIGGNYVDSCSSPDGISENENSSEFYFYPNPTSDEVTVKLKSEKINKLAFIVFNSLGQVVIQSKINLLGSEFKIDVSKLPVGIYFLQVEMRDGIIRSRKLVKL
ncbi:MAG: T9SS type A sorting domain-containing protein [Bacteroidota bacterium]